MSTALVLLALVGAAIAYVISIYNRLISLRNQHTNAFSQIEVQLKRRYDLIPTLVKTAKAYMSHEQETLQQVIQARNAAQQSLKAVGDAPDAPGGMAQLAGAENVLSGALGRMNMVMEAYPDLKANQNMMQLNEELASTENRVSFARQAFNDAVTSFNDYRASFPPVFFATKFGHPCDAELLEFENSEQLQEMPEVEF